MQYYMTQKHIKPILQDLAPILHVHDKDLFLPTTPQQPAWGASSFFNFLHYCEKNRWNLFRLPDNRAFIFYYFLGKPLYFLKKE
jgi:hypothetical protein